MCVTPSRASNSTVSTQRTGFGTCSYNPILASAPVEISRACQLFTSGTLKFPNEVASRSACNIACAGLINGQWNGALTASAIHRFAPAALANSMALSTAPLFPAITIWSGEFKFAAVTTSPCAASASTPSSAASGIFKIAAIAPTPAGTAACMYCPRFRTSRSASANPRLSAATSAEYSPRLCPATKAGTPTPRLRNTRNAATLVATSAGCVFSVRFKSSSGPSKQSFEMENPNASSASSKVSLATSNCFASSCPIPGNCDPCPGNKYAIFIKCNLVSRYSHHNLLRSLSICV